MATFESVPDNSGSSQSNSSVSEQDVLVSDDLVTNSASDTMHTQDVLSHTASAAHKSHIIDAGESDSEAEHFEDAMDALDLGSSKAESRTAEGETEFTNVEESMESRSDETGDDSGDCVINEDVIRAQEAKLTEEEKERRTLEAKRLKDLGNERFKEGGYNEAIVHYSDALMSCLLCQKEDRAIIYSNRAAAYMKLEKYDDAIRDSSKALEYNPDYMKALLRRAELYERVEKLDEALEDYKKALERDPSLHQARAACMRLPEQINVRNEKLKTEMMGKLKDLGNLILRPFGLSTDNFKLQQDPATGSYSVNFQQANQ